MSGFWSPDQAVTDVGVVSLTYRLAPVEQQYRSPPPVEYENNDLWLRLDAGLLVVRPKSRITSVNAARNMVESFLDAWRVSAALNLGREALRFVYDHADLEGANGMMVHAAGTATAAASMLISNELREYPDPPSGFVTTPDVLTLWQRYEGYTLDREPLQAMAYFCLTVVKGMAGGEREAEDQLNLGRRILNKLGQLTSTRGDALTARKADVTGPLSSSEHRWVIEVTKSLIWRVGSVEAGEPLPRLSFTDLPPLDDD